MKLFIPILATLLVMSTMLTLFACGGSTGSEGDPVMIGYNNEIDDHDDVTATSPSDNQALTYDAGSSGWISEAAPYTSATHTGGYAFVWASNATFLPSYSSTPAGQYFGDGTDDQVQIRAAIAAVGTGGVVQLSDGNFEGTTQTISAGGVKIRAAGKGATIYTIADGTNQSAFVFTATPAVYDCEISGLTIEGNSTNQSAGSGIYVKNSRRVVVKDMKINDCYAYGVHFDGSGSANTNGFSAENNWITSNTNSGIYAQRVYNWGIKGNYSARNGDHGYSVSGGGEGTITNNAADTNSKRGIYVFGSDRMTITDNRYIGDNGQSGIELADKANNNLVALNLFMDNGSANGANQTNAIYVSGFGADNLITGNTAFDFDGGHQDYGANIGTSASNTAVIGNDFRGNVITSGTNNGYSSTIRNNDGWTTEVWDTTVIQTDSLSYQQADGDSKYIHEYYLPAFNASAGGSGATWTAPTVQTLGGYRLDADTEYLYFNTHMEADWDGSGTPTLEISYETNTAVGAAGGATVEFDTVFKWKSTSDTITTTNTATATQIVGNTVKGKSFECSIAPDLVGLASADVFSLRLNLNTTLSEIDDVIFVYAEFKYPTQKPAPEAL